MNNRLLTRTTVDRLAHSLARDVSLDKPVKKLATKKSCIPKYAPFRCNISLNQHTRIQIQPAPIPKQVLEHMPTDINRSKDQVGWLLRLMEKA